MDSHVDTKVDSHTVKNLQELLVRLEALQVDGKGLDDKSNSMEILRTKIPDPPIHFSGPTKFFGPKIDFTNHQF